MDLADDFVLCTRNRAETVRVCLASVAAQTHVPDVVAVIDSSDDDATRELIDELTPTWPTPSSLRYLHAVPGLTSQRNAGLWFTSNPIVHFLDDDTVLEPSYFAEIMATFAADPLEAIAGVGGFVTNQPAHEFRRIDEWLGLDSRREGSVLPSGRNVRVHTDPGRDIEVDWLPGCAMSYRRSALIVEPPNAQTAFHSEDVDLSYRVRQHARLVVTPRARVRHDEIDDGRLHGAPLVEREILARWERVRTGVGAYSTRAFRRSLWGQLVRYGIPAVLTLKPERRAIVTGTWRGMRAIRRLP